MLDKTIVIFGASSELALDLAASLSEFFNIICVSQKIIKPFNEKIRTIKLKDYSSTEIHSISSSLDMSKEHIFLFMNGITDKSAFYKLEKEEISNVLKVNLELPILATNVLLKEFLNQSTRYVYFSSSRALLGDKGIALYSASKSGLINFSRSLSLEYGKYKQFFYTISLGVFDKGLVKKVKKETLDRIIKRSAINNYVDLIQLREMIIFIANNTASTGSNFYLDNGYHLKYFAISQDKYSFTN